MVLKGARSGRWKAKSAAAETSLLLALVPLDATECVGARGLQLLLDSKPSWVRKTELMVSSRLLTEADGGLDGGRGDRSCEGHIVRQTLYT